MSRDFTVGRVIISFLLCAPMVSCTAPRDQTPRPNPVSPPIPRDTIDVDTPEMIRILEEEHISCISTWHSQAIDIVLADGRAFSGSYKQSEAGKYSEDPRFFDILNLVLHIIENKERVHSDGITIAME